MKDDLLVYVTLKLPDDLIKDIVYLSDKLFISRDAYITAIIWDHFLSINDSYKKVQRKKNEKKKKT